MTSVTPSITPSPAPLVFTPSPPSNTAPPRTVDGINAENAPRNHSESRHDAGKLDVPSDGPVLPPSAPSSASVTSPVKQWMASFTTMSPNSKAQAKKAFDVFHMAETFPSAALASTAAPASNAPKIYYSGDSEVPFSLDSTFGLGIHSTITDLAEAQQYIPLILFTDDSTKRLHREGHTLAKVKSVIAGTTYHLIDISTFPAEDSLDAFTWNQAWKRYLLWLKVVSAPSVYERWLWHYSNLSSDPCVLTDFTAILSFDIDVRSRYAVLPFRHDELKWHLQLQAAKITANHNSSLLRDDRVPISHCRYEPYDSSRKSSNTKRRYK